ADLLTLHFKAVDGNGNAVTSTPVHYTTAVTDAGIVKDTPACTTDGSGECTSTVKTTKAGTYNVWVALVPAGAAQPVSPVKTALVFLAGPPDATNTTVSTDKSAANADNKETITVTLNPRDSHNNVVPLWTFRKDLTIVPSVNATVPGAVTVTTPAQDAAGLVAATLTYVDTSGKLLSKEARTGTTTIAIGSAVKKTFDTRFYPQVNVCLTNLDSNGFVTPGTTEVHICDGSKHTIQSGSGYTVTAPGISTSGCPANGGGVCPSDSAGVKADFENLTGDDIRTLASTQVTFQIRDLLAGRDMTSKFTAGNIAYYGELKAHKPYTGLGATGDVFHTVEARAYCSAVSRSATGNSMMTATEASLATRVGTPSGGTLSADGTMQTLYIGNIANAIHTGGDTNPEIFVDGISPGRVKGSLVDTTRAIYNNTDPYSPVYGAYFPSALIFVNGKRAAATTWTMTGDGVDYQTRYVENNGRNDDWPSEVSIGYRLAKKTGWNLSDSYFVNNWPGTPLTLHKGNGDSAYHYVTQVNYITGYFCAASLH
ncbi:Ig-like domain-containing protein, partial [Salmonella enterica]|nr:Ig-like domain-containing protein [Salmonella enterica]